MIEAMTEGGFKKRGTVFCPADALEGDPVILKYLRHFPERITVIEPRKKYCCGDFSFMTSPRHKHPVETYGLKFRLDGQEIGYMVDTAFAPGLFPFYRTPLLIIGVVMVEPRPELMHLSFTEVKSIVEKLKPEKTVLTHFGMRMLKANPRRLAEELARESGREVVAAYDGMSLEFP
jgi:phosphoribosyl 1,2-cyclic phosphodiesterase